MREVIRFEIAYQLRAVATWLYFLVLVAVALLFMRGSSLSDALYTDFYFNSPFVIATVTVFGSMLWFLLAAPVAGAAAARDVEVGIHPITYTVPISRARYLGGRFIAAFTVNVLILLGLPTGVLLAVYLPGVDTEVIGPFRLAAYLSAFGFIALPNAFIGTAIQFAWAALSRRSIAAYLGSVVLFFLAYGGFLFVSFYLEREDLGALLDVFGHLYITSDLILGWTPIEKSVRLIELEGTLLNSRIVWLGIALAALAFTFTRFRFAHPIAGQWSLRLRRRSGVHAPLSEGNELAKSAIPVPRVHQAFDFATQLRQTLAIAAASFGAIAKSRGGLVLLAGIALLLVVVLPQNMVNMGTPLLPTTEYVLTFLTAPLTKPMTQWVVIPLLIVFWAGELVWREREAGLGEITEAAPVPEWVLFVGRFLGLGLVLAVWMALLTAAGMLTQLRMDYHQFDIGLYLHVLFGLQLPEYLLFAVLAIVIQGVATQKYFGHLAALVAYAIILFTPTFWIEHNLLVYSASPGWTYSDIRGFGPSLGPWLWFKLYWAAWALMLAIVGRLLWLRGMERGVAMRLRLARRRFTTATVRAASVAVMLILGLGGFIFYNTNVLNDYVSAAERVERRAAYERLYGRYAEIPQPRLVGTSLRIEIYPERRAAEIRGSYRLVNDGADPIDSIHLATVPAVETGPITFDRPVRTVFMDERLGHHVYALAEALKPGESLRLGFEVRFRPEGFGNHGIDPAVTEMSTYFRNFDLFPAIGYKPDRELISAGDRRAHGLPPRPLIPSLADVEAGQDITGETSGAATRAHRVDFEAVIGTVGDQIAVAPGVLRRSWTEGDRRYFHYASDGPIGNELAFFSAPYAVHEEQWNDVAIQIYHHPSHVANLDRMLRSVRASLANYSEQFGPYPHSHIRLVENPGTGFGMHAEMSLIDYTEGFSRFNPQDDPRGLDLTFAVVAHEMAHQWQVPHAFAEGAALLTESFAWYAAMGVVEATYGREHLRRLLRFFRQPSPIPPIRQSAPLLQAMDPYAAYRKGPFALFALREYVGEDRVNLAWRRLIEAHRSGQPPLPTSLDLYRELQAVTPDSLRYLLHDLLEANTFWEFETERAAARRTPGGDWEVTLDVRARKVTVDPAGVETVIPMDERVQIGVFAPSEPGADFGETLYLQMHRIRSGEQTIKVTVPGEPADAGIDPFHLLIELERFDNVEEVDIEG